MSNFGTVQKPPFSSRGGRDGFPLICRLNSVFGALSSQNITCRCWIRVIRHHQGGGKGGKFGGLNKATEFQGQSGQTTIAANTLTALSFWWHFLLQVLSNYAITNSNCCPVYCLPLLCSIYFAYSSAEGPMGLVMRNCIPLKLFYIQEIKAEEEGEVGRNENAFAKLSQDTDLKTSFHWERSPAPCGSTESVYRAVPFHCSCLLDVSAGEIFHSLYSSVLKERSLVDVTVL